MALSQPRCVFDCMVLLQAAASPAGPSGQCLRALFQGQIELHVSRVTLGELRDVMAYPAVLQRFPKINDAMVEPFIEEVRWRSVYHRQVPRLIDLSRDTRDEPYLDLAIATEADILTTRDRDMLDLVTGRDVAAKTLRQLAPQLRIVTPEMLLGELVAV